MPEIQPSPKFRGGTINCEFPKFDQNQTRGHTSRLKDRASKGLVHVVDDDASFQTATGYLLKHAGYEVASYPSAEHLLDHLPKESVRGCILVKFRMPGLSGLDLQECLSDLGSALPIIFFTRYLDIPTVVRTIKAGALDFLMKPISSDQLLQAVGRAIAHHDATRTLNAVRSRTETLTPRELEVFKLVVLGQTNKHAARSLGCAERTIKAHRHRVMQKMQVRSLPELVSLAERVGVMAGNGHSA
jgi:FixJ family two-component response regulator